MRRPISRLPHKARRRRTGRQRHTELPLRTELRWAHGQGLQSTELRQRRVPRQRRERVLLRRKGLLLHKVLLLRMVPGRQPHKELPRHKVQQRMEQRRHKTLLHSP